MRRIRIGKDIAMRWTILTDGQPTDLANRKLLIEARAANGRVCELEYTTEKNTAIFTFFGKEQRFTGNYTITLWENKGEEKQNVVDKVSAFSLVRSTDEEDNSVDAENNLEVETIDLGTTDFTLMGGGSTPVDIFSGTELKMMDGTEYFVVKKDDEMHIITAATMQSFFGNGQGGGSAAIPDGSVTEEKLSNDVKTKINTAASDAANAKTAAQTANSNAATASKLADAANTAATQAKETANGKQEKLTLEVLNNGNIKIGNLNGQTKEFMPATPSGDPMHYAYEAMGAVWNTEDSISETPWASLVDDADYNAQWGLNLIPEDALFVKNVEYKGDEKEVWEITHPCSGRAVWVVAEYSSSGVKIWDETKFVLRKGRWAYFAVGDLTNDNIRDIYEQGVANITETFSKAYMNGLSKQKGVTNRLFVGNLNLGTNFSGTFFGNKGVEYHIFDIGFSQEWIQQKLSRTFSSGSLKHLYTKGNLQPSGASLSNTLLTTVPLSPNQSFTIKSNEISKKSILRAINKSTQPSSGDLTITLPVEAYNRLNEDADIKALLENYDYINLASA